MLSSVMEDYLKAIYYLQEETDGRVQTSALATHLDVEQSTATSMMKKLAEREFVHYEPYKGVELTPTGTPIALEVIRHHRLLEQYLTEHLEYDWSEVHPEADRLEHHISDQFAARIAEQLDNPEVDPHGDPIPTPELEVSSLQRSETLTDQQAGDRVSVERVADQDPAILRYLSEHGIQLGATAEIVEIAPFGMVTLTLDDQEDPVALPEDVARSVIVRSLTQPTEA